MKILFFALLGYLVGVAPAQAFDDADCSRIEVTNINISEELRAGELSDVTRTRAIDQAAREAVEQIVGTALRAKRSLEASSVNGQNDERFAERAMAQSKGLVRTRVVSESPASTAIAYVIEIKVCIPVRADVLKDVVVLGPLLSSRGEAQPKLHDILAEIFSTSDSFTLGSDADGYADVTISGRIAEVEIKTVSSSGNTNLSGGSPILGGGSAGPEIQRLRADVVLNAAKSDGTTITEDTSDFINVPANKDPTDAINSFMPKLIARAAENLRSKLISARSNAGPAQKPSNSTPGAPVKARGLNW